MVSRVAWPSAGEERKVMLHDYKQLQPTFLQANLRSVDSFNAYILLFFTVSISPGFFLVLNNVFKIFKGRNDFEKAELSKKYESFLPLTFLTLCNKVSNFNEQRGQSIQSF